MGLGRVYHPRSGALSVIGSGSSAHLQLVELICAAGESQSPLGSDHQPPVFALGGGAPDHSWRRKTSQYYFSACRGRQSESTARGYSCANQQIQKYCGAVQTQIGLAASVSTFWPLSRASDLKFSLSSLRQVRLCCPPTDLFRLTGLDRLFFVGTPLG